MPLSKAFELDEILLNELVGIVAGADDPTVFGFDAPIGSLYLRTNGETYVKQGAGVTAWTVNSTGGGAGSDELVGVSADDTTPGYLEDKIVVANAVNTAAPLELNVLNDGADEDLQLSFDQTKLSITEAQISDLGDYVDLTNPQTITGVKTFANGILTSTIDEASPGTEVTLGADNGAGNGKLSWDGERLLFDSFEATFDSLEIGWIQADGAGAWGIGRNSIAGALWFVPDAVNPQFLAGDNSNTGTWFFDANGNKDLLFQALDTGPGTSNDKRTGFGEGGIFLLDVSGNNEVAIRAPELVADYLLILPEDDGDPGFALTTDGLGVLSWKEYVTIDTPQTITGQKTFTQAILVDDIEEATPAAGVTLTANNGAGDGTVKWDGEEMIFSVTDNTFDDLAIGWIDTYSGNEAWGITRLSAGGAFWLMTGAAFPQLFLGDRTDSGACYIDGNGNKDIILNALDTGPGTAVDKAVGIGPGGLYIFGTSGGNQVNIQVPNIAADYTLTLPVDDGDAGQSLQTDGAGVLSWETVEGAIVEVNSATNGFVDKNTEVDAAISFTDGTRTFEITPTAGSYDIYNRGNKFTISAAQSVVWDDTTGVKLFYFDATGTLQFTNTADPTLFIENETAVAYCYWNATENKTILSGPEFHGILLDSRTHLYNHNTFGARFGFGLLPFNVIDNGNGDVDAHAQFAIESGEIWDEDIQILIPSLAVGDTTWTVLWREGTGWNGVDNHPFPVWNGPLPSPDRAFWNEETSPGVWAAVEVGNDGDFVLYHIFATNDPDRPFVSIMGQNQYLNGGQARDGAPIELLSLQKEGLPTFEFKAIATFIFQTNDGAYTNQVHSRIRDGDNDEPFIDWRLQVQTGTT